MISPILLPPISVNQRLPSGPAVIPEGMLPAVGIGELGDGVRSSGDLADLVAAVLGEPEVAVGPGRDPVGQAEAAGSGELGDDCAVGVIRPILLAGSCSVNQRLPSGPAAIRRARPPAVGTANSVMACGGRVDLADLVAGRPR